MSKRNPAWNDGEQMAVCLAYALMARAADPETGKLPHGTKSKVRAELRGTDAAPGPLAARSNGSIEAKFMNCTAAAITAGLPTVKGYKPAPNYQKSLVGMLKQAYALVDAQTVDGLGVVDAVVKEA
jgi:hypothetical protein